MQDINLGAPVRRITSDGSFFSAAQSQLRVVGALMMRDIYMRYNSRLGYVIAILWPMSHFGIILAIYLILGSRPPYGIDVIKWIATGALPFIAFQYPVRFIPLAISENRSLLSFPAVKSIDILLSRIMVETLTAFTVFLFLLFVLMLMNTGMEIASFGVVLLGITEALYLGVGLGVFAFAIIRVWPGLFVFVILFIILVWATMGIFFLPDTLPDQAKFYISFNPLLHAAEKVRAGFYNDYKSNTMNEFYLLSLSTVLFLAGLLLDRFASRFANN